MWMGLELQPPFKTNHNIIGSGADLHEIRIMLDHIY